MSIFPDGYFSGRLVSKSYQQESLLLRRPHPTHSQWCIERCLNCHMDVWASSQVHSIIVVSLKSYHGDEVRKWRDTDLYSKYFNILIRQTSFVPASGLGTSPLTPDTSLGSGGGGGGSASASITAALPGVFQLQSSLNAALEAERVSMETRLSQLRAVEEAKYAEVENKIRHQFATLLAQVEREAESGILASGGVGSTNAAVAAAAHHSHHSSASHLPNLSTDGLASPHMAAFDHRGTSPRISHAIAADSLSPRGSTTRISELLAAAQQSLSPLGGTGSSGLSTSLSSNPRISLTRANSRSNRDSAHTPPLGSSVSEMIENRLASSVIAVPLDLHRAAPTTPTDSATTGAVRAQRKSLSQSMKVAPPRSTDLASTSVTPSSTNTAATSGVDGFQLDGGVANVPPHHPISGTMVDGVVLDGVVPFDQDGSTNVTHFDDFVLPADDDENQGGNGTIRSGADDAIFDLDEEVTEERETTLDSPTNKTIDDELDGDILDEEEEEEDGELEGELSDSEAEDATPIVVSSKAAKLLGMGDSRSNSNSTSSTAAPLSSSIIRPRTSSGTTGVTMVPMSLPISIPAQLLGQRTNAPTNPAGAVAQPARAESGLARSLKATTNSFIKPPVALSNQPSYSDEEDSGLSDEEHRPQHQRKYTDDETGVIPPHTLVDEPFFSFAKVQKKTNMIQSANGSASDNDSIQYFSTNFSFLVCLLFYFRFVI